jgi:hypothetical protein
MEIKINQERYTEALAATCYFLQKRKITTNELVAIVDIGGGSTEFAFWKERKILWQDSVKFAGSDLLELTPKLVDAIVDKGKDLEDKIKFFTMYKMNWPYIHPTWDGKLLEELDKEDFRKEVYFGIGIFFSAICYYIGLHLRAKNINEKIGAIAFAGNGIKFLEIVTRGNRINQNILGQEWIELFRNAVINGHNKSDLYPKDSKIEFIFSEEPKFEVAKGLLYNEINQYMDNGVSLKKLFGIRFYYRRENKHYEEFDWDKHLTASDFAVFTDNRDYTLVNNYLEFFRKNFKSIVPIPNLPSRFDQTDDLNRELNIVLENRGQKELACSLFLEAVKIYAKLAKNLSLNDTENFKTENFEIDVNLDNNGRKISKIDYTDKYYIKEITPGKYGLFIREKSLAEKPTSGSDKMFELFFTIEKDDENLNREFNRYLLIEPAVIKVNWFNENEGYFEIVNKGKLKYGFN